MRNFATTTLAAFSPVPGPRRDWRRPRASARFATNVQRDECAPRAHGSQIGGRVRCAAEDAPHSPYADDQDGRLGGDAAALAGQVLVEDGVAEHQHASGGEAGDDRSKASGAFDWSHLSGNAATSW